MRLIYSLAMAGTTALLCFAREAKAAEPFDLKFAAGTIEAHCVFLDGGPLSSIESRLEIQWRDVATKRPLNPPGQFKIEIDMPDMPMNNPPVEIVPSPPGPQKPPIVGAYLAHIFFTMAGSWELRTTLTDADGRNETQATRFDVDR